MLISILLIIFLIILNGFFSGVEASFLSLDLFFIEIKTEKKHKFSLLYYILTKPHIFITTILIGTNISLISATQILSKYFNSNSIIYKIFLFFIFPFIVLIFGEIYPKIIFRKYSYTISKIAVYPFTFFQITLSPIVFIFNLISKLIELIFTSKKTVNLRRKEEEIINILGRSLKKKFSNVELFFEDAIKFDQISLCDIQKPIFSLKTIDYEEDELIDISTVYENYEKNCIIFSKTDEFLGILNIDSIFASNNIKKAYKFDELPLIKNIPAIYEGKSVLNAIELFNKTSVPIILTINEFGETSGLVTKEDIFSFISNTITTNESLFKYSIKKVGQNSYIVSGFTELTKLSRIIGVSIKDDYYHTFNGYIVHYLGRIPEEGESFTINDAFEIRIVSASKKFIEKAIIRIINSKEKQ